MLLAVWNFRKINHKEGLFSGPDATVKTLQDGNAYNILIDKDLTVRRYVLRNSTTGIHEAFFFDKEELMTKMADNSVGEIFPKYEMNVYEACVNSSFLSQVLVPLRYYLLQQLLTLPINQFC